MGASRHRMTCSRAEGTLRRCCVSRPARIAPRRLDMRELIGGSALGRKARRRNLDRAAKFVELDRTFRALGILRADGRHPLFDDEGPEAAAGFYQTKILARCDQCSGSARSLNERAGRRVIGLRQAKWRQLADPIRRTSSRQLSAGAGLLQRKSCLWGHTRAM